MHTDRSHGGPAPCGENFRGEMIETNSANQAERKAEIESSKLIPRIPTVPRSDSVSIQVPRTEAKTSAWFCPTAHSPVGHGCVCFEFVPLYPFTDSLYLHAFPKGALVSFQINKRTKCGYALGRAKDKPIFREERSGAERRHQSTLSLPQKPPQHGCRTALMI